MTDKIDVETAARALVFMANMTEDEIYALAEAIRNHLPAREDYGRVSYFILALNTAVNPYD